MYWWLYISCDFMAKIENERIKYCVKRNKLHYDLPVIKMTRTPGWCPYCHLE